jgi:prophage antirepressor-like protein
MEIFNNIIKVNNEQIMIIYDKEGEIWFKLKNITQLLGYTSINKQLNLLKLNNDNIKQYFEISRPPHIIGVPWTINSKLLA